LVCAQGTQSELKDFIEYLHEGSIMAKTADVGVTWRSAEQEYDDFSVAY
jgi:acylphosphatase